MGKRKLAVTDLDQTIAELVSKSDHKVLVTWAADCAERVLPYFEEKYPEDERPRNAIKAGRAWVHGDLKMTEARKAAFAAHAAARDADRFRAASSAARATGHTAATAHVADHATSAAIYAATAVRDATKSEDDDIVITREREWQYQRLLALGEK